MLRPETENIAKILRQHDKEIEAFDTEMKDLKETSR